MVVAVAVLAQQVKEMMAEKAQSLLDKIVVVVVEQVP
jgi:hypothetical protein